MNAFNRILRKRAERLARIKDEDCNRQIAMQIVILVVGEQRIGIPVEGLRELLELPIVASLPRLPSWMPGIVQIRGELSSVVDLATWFGIQNDATANCLAVVEGESGAVGLIANSVLGFRDVYADEISKDLKNLENSIDQQVQATTNDLVAILDLQILLEKWVILQK